MSQTPTVSRQLHYYSKKHNGPCPATVCKVHEDGTVNIAYYSDVGIQYNALRVKVLAEGERTTAESYCVWPPIPKQHATGVHAVKSAEQMAKGDPATETEGAPPGSYALSNDETRCDRPPAGWFCTRLKGHDGPCAARQLIPTN